jgi:putative membrane protein
MATPDSKEPGQPPEPGDAREPWWEQGEEPDYRATLANERTFLAWTRTSLAFLAGSLAILPLHDVAPLRLRLALSAYLIALAVVTTVTGYVQWRRRQQRMRHRRPLGHSPWQAVLLLGFLLLAGLVCAVVATGSG